LRERKKENLITTTEEEHLALKAKIEEWLEAEGISFKHVPDLNSYFHLETNLKNAPIHLHESKVRRGVLVVQGVLSLTDSQLEIVVKMTEEDKKTLFLSLFAILDKSEYLFMIQQDFSSESWVRIQRTLYVEDLTRTRLLGEMKDLNTKFVNMNYALNEALGRIVAVSDESSIYT
jgi:hypothetical protein